MPTPWHLNLAFVLAVAFAAAVHAHVLPVDEEVRPCHDSWWWCIIYHSSSIWCLLGDACILVPAAIVGVTMVGYLFNSHRQQRRRSSCKAIVPFATISVIDVVRGMTSDHPHSYLHDLARKCQKRTFRLPLPIFRVFQLRCGWRRRRCYFYLPLPIVRRVFVVGDVPTARRILQDATSDKPPEIYTSFEGITDVPVMFTCRNSGYTRSVRRSAHHAFSMKDDDDGGGGRIRAIAQKHIDQWLGGRLRDLSDNDEGFDPVDEALALTFFIICEVAFDYPATYDEFRMFTDNLDLALSEFAYRQSTNPLRKVFGIFLPGVWRAKRAAGRVMEFAGHMRQSYVSRNTTSRANKGGIGTTFMDHILTNPELSDVRQQTSEMVMFMAAGHETSGSMISNTMILLAKHTKWQTMLRESVAKEEDDSNKLLQNFLCEANRVSPVAPMGSTRCTGKDFVLSNGGVIPANSICFLPQYMYYQDEEIFANPGAFDPGRWERSTNDMRDAASMTFSLGPRNCPGKPLATVELNYLLPHLLRRYSLHLEREGLPEYRVIMKNSDSIIKVKELAAVDNERSETTLPCRPSHEPTKSTAKKTQIASRLFHAGRAFLVVGLAVLFGINAAKPRPLEQKKMNVAILTEPSPIGSYICGQSKRIEFLMQYLIEDTNDTVDLITTEVHDSIRPSSWRGVSVHYTHGFRLQSYNQISISFDFTMKALRELYRAYPDIIHVTTPGPLLFPAVIASRSFGTPIVMSCHTHLTAYARTYLPPGINIFAEWLLWGYTKAVHSFADLTLVTSPQIQEDFARNGIPAEVWRKGVDSSRFHPDNYDADMRYRMTAGNSDDYLLVYIGRLADEKRLVVLKEVIQNISDATLCLVGAGPYEQTLREHFEGTKTIFLGQLSGVELSQAFASADVFVMPSTSETLGFVVLESMASGVPVVAANAGGLKHLIKNETTGFLVTPDRPETFVNAIERLKSTSILRSIIAEAARREAELWTWEKSMGELRYQLYPRAMKSFENRLERRALRGLKSAMSFYLK